MKAKVMILKLISTQELNRMHLAEHVDSSTVDSEVCYQIIFPTILGKKVPLRFLVRLHHQNE